METWVVTTAPKSRLPDVLACFAEMEHDPGHSVVVTTAPDPIPTEDVDAYVVHFGSEEFNISKWWSAGLDFIAAHAETRYNVLLVESDVRIGPDAVQALATALRSTQVGMVGADWQHSLAPGDLHIHHDRVTINQAHRLPGVALMVRGELGIRHDPQFRWWFADDDFEWQHRFYGTALVGGTTLSHAGTTPLVGELAQWAAEDGERFRVKWGAMPI